MNSIPFSIENIENSFTFKINYQCTVTIKKICYQNQNLTFSIWCQLKCIVFTELKLKNQV